ncbi:MAG: NADH-quinone oxidoreductase subunit NuoE [Dethiobacteria bacterium]|nr:NADH-quinone oxidoreductase subunit NuoE [Bacillota bacterium]MDW7730193.1 NADH-quinone oxidoreductase subunit NuoE [Bacillota bacterium]
MKEQLETVFEAYKGEKSELIPVLQHVQKEIGYLPEEAMKHIARFVRVPESKVYGVATFYAQFKMKPRGRYIIRVCKGTACHIQGSPKIASKIEEILKIESGDTTPDLKYTLEEVACIGACALAPVMMINNDPHGRLSPDKIKGILDSYE